MNRNLLRVMQATINSVTSDECNGDIAVTETEMEDTYKKIVDKLAHSIFFAAVDDEMLLEAFDKLSRMEKIIVVFNIMLDYSSSDIAVLADSTEDSVYSQKYKSLEKLRKALGVK